ncbi:MAG TPA: DUF465 domain-containing protein [Alphaproteobacteria bacterium]|nr:DUF465 domain-containing protein [Alphaproteobacteria bacterium]
MSLNDRIDSLKAKHQALKSAIEEEKNHTYPNEDELHILKKEKLKIKDELASLNAV